MMCTGNLWWWLMHRQNSHTDKKFRTRIPLRIHRISIKNRPLPIQMDQRLRFYPLQKEKKNNQIFTKKTYIYIVTTDIMNNNNWRILPSENEEKKVLVKLCFIRNKCSKTYFLLTKEKHKRAKPNPETNIQNVNDREKAACLPTNYIYTYTNDSIWIAYL